MRKVGTYNIGLVVSRAQSVDLVGIKREFRVFFLSFRKRTLRSREVFARKAFSLYLLSPLLFRILGKEIVDQEGNRLEKKIVFIVGCSGQFLQFL